MTGNCFASIGVVSEASELTIAGLSGSIVIKAGLADMKEVWQKTLKDL
jgi:phosphoribosylformylglycinamidine synthase